MAAICRLRAVWSPTQPSMPFSHVHQGGEYDQHGAHVHGQFQAVGGADGQRVEEVVAELFFGYVQVFLNKVRLRFGEQQLGADNGGRGAHDALAEHVQREIFLLAHIGAAQQPHIGRQHAARGIGEAAHHDTQVSPNASFFKIRPDHQRGLSLPEEDIGRRGKSFPHRKC